MSQALIVVAASIFVMLGSLHGLLTLRDISNPTSFTPRDPALRHAMQESGIAFHPDVNLWKAWLGFNLTHSLGIVLFGGAFLYIGLFVPGAYAGSRALQAVAVSVSATYLAISVFFFFSGPVIGSAMATVCFLAAAVT